MFFPNEIIIEILIWLDYQTWIDKINKVNKQYHSYYYYTDFGGEYESVRCKRHYGQFVVNWRNNGCHRPCKENNIYQFCVDSKYHESKEITISDIKLPHNY